MLKTVVASYCSGDSDFIFQDYLMNRKFKRTALIWNLIFCDILNVFAVAFEQLFNAE